MNSKGKKVLEIAREVVVGMGVQALFSAADQTIRTLVSERLKKRMSRQQENDSKNSETNNK